MTIRDAQAADLPRLLAIYNHAVRTSTATFDLLEPTFAKRQTWLSAHGGRYPLLVAELDGVIAGYCSLSRFRDKPGYDRTAESSVYIDPVYHRRGIGRQLMSKILMRAAELGYHVVVAGVVGGNLPSVRLHEELGFRQVGCLREVGRKFGEWQDVLWYQYMVPGR